MICIHITYKSKYLHVCRRALGLHAFALAAATIDRIELHIVEQPPLELLQELLKMMHSLCPKTITYYLTRERETA